MEANSPKHSQQSTVRQLANLKLLSRLLGHELRSQGNARSITLSREQVTEMQTTVDLFIEEVGRTQGLQGAHGAGGTRRASETQMVSSRN